MKRIIVLTVSLCLIGAIALTTILMAVIPVGKIVEIQKPDLKVAVATEDTSSIGSGYITLRGKTSQEDYRQEDIDSIWDAFQGSVKQNALSALFNGTVSDGIEFKSEKNFKYFSLKTTEEGFARIVFEYAEPQIAKHNGKNVLTDEKDEKTVIEYEIAYIEITSKDARQEVKVYIGEWSGTQIKAKHYYVMNGNFAELYKVVTGLKTSV